MKGAFLNVRQVLPDDAGGDFIQSWLAYGRRQKTSKRKSLFEQLISAPKPLPSISLQHAGYGLGSWGTSIAAKVLQSN
jgi:hypothetical protein